ncbi:TNT domain-containing protein [Williamsia sp. M5A3_1d]
MPTLVVDPAQYAQAASNMSEVARSAHAAIGSLAGELGASSGMGGSDNAGVEWSNSYDDGARAALQAAAAAVGASGNVATRLHATGENHAHADASATIGGGDSGLPGAPTPPTMSAPSPPSAAGGGGGGGGEPPGWSLVEGVVGYVWPNGHQDRLHAADGAWKAAAAQLESAAAPTSAAASAVAAQKSPEAAAAAQACTDTGNHLRELSSVFTQIGASCSEYAAHLDEAHHEIISTLKELIVETAAIEAGGAALAFFTAGLDEIAAQAAVAARIASAAAKIRRVIEVLIEAARAVAASVRAGAARALDVLGKLKPLAEGAVKKVGLAARTETSAARSGQAFADDLARAKSSLPEWAHPELDRALNPQKLHDDLVANGVPRQTAEDALRNNPYAHDSPTQIVEKYWNKEDGGWQYPKESGFDGPPSTSHSIPSGTQIDRIGGERGEFLGRQGDSYGERALCPGKSAPYYRYEGTGDSVPGWEVRSGPIAPAFGKPGGGFQWLVVDTSGGSAVPVPVEQLVDKLIRAVPN